MKFLLFLLALLFPFLLFAQQQVTVSGYVNDTTSGENLYAATIYEVGSGRGAAVNRYGFFSFSIPQGKIQLMASFVGYTTQFKSFILQNDTIINFKLIPENTILEEVEVKAKYSSENEPDIGFERISVKTLDKLPSLLGERDVMKSLMLLPGVQQGTEGSAGIYVRGGSPDQNLILLDDVALYNATHLFGLTSVFTPEALQGVDFYKGGFPARYGGRLSSVIDVRMREGNKYQTKGQVNFGILSSSLTLEGPIQKGKSSFLISGRRTLLDLLMRGLIAISNNGLDEVTEPGYQFHDVNAKINFDMNQKNRLFLSFYNGGDKLFVNYRNKLDTSSETLKDVSKNSIGWGNTVLSARWNTQPGNKLFGNTTLTWSRFHYAVNCHVNNYVSRKNEETQNDYNLGYGSNIETLGVKTDWDYYLKDNHPLQFGSFFYYHTYLPGEKTVARNGAASVYTSGYPVACEYGVYADQKFAIGEQFSFSPGIRLSLFSTSGKTYSYIEPRISLSYKPKENSVWSVAYSRMTQPVHLLTNNNIGLPSDIWEPTTKTIEPERSGMVSAGYKQTIGSNIELGVEAYYKSMNKVVEYKEGYGFTDINEDWEDYIAIGKGKAWGTEASLKYTASKVETWVGYTLSWNNRKFENINNGEWYPYKYDRRHKIDCGLLYQLSPVWSLAATWTFQSGLPISYTTMDYSGYPDNISYDLESFFTGSSANTERIQYYNGINQSRLPSYHRLDVSVSKKWKHGKTERELTLGIYNLYCRFNPYYVYKKTRTDGISYYEQLSLFPILPAVSYRISF